MLYTVTTRANSRYNEPSDTNLSVLLRQRQSGGHTYVVHRAANGSKTMLDRSLADGLPTRKGKITSLADVGRVVHCDDPWVES